jgi:hypothetical protein
MSSVPFFTAGPYKVWIAGHGAYRNEARALFERLAAGLAERSGSSGKWQEIRDIVSGRRAAAQSAGGRSTT